MSRVDIPDGYPKGCTDDTIKKTEKSYPKTLWTI